ncbi:MAG TPA: CU044_5270 family protein [Actinophytocola sp.]|uniref:CU044_5270 family protein n=1 Tax=Actinophytocola sp. TaxID=1872138 RepID=UPI002DBC377A|nr:CU044_5270 family protein [Actinophytocola sp.]HEU5471791.1 CU044_5270 family protein [Actinophytocola sp.]
MTEGKVRRVWSDEELDLALATLYADVDTDERRLRETRTGLVGERQETRDTRESRGTRGVRRGRQGQRGRRSWILAAAAVTALVAGLGMVQMIISARPGPPPDPGQPGAAARALEAAADRVVASAPVISPGQYRYGATQTWDRSDWPGPTRELSMRTESRTESWIPGDLAGECLLRIMVTGRYEWIVGTDEEALGTAMGRPEASNHEDRRPCPEFREVENWWMPRPAWLAGLPRDPDQLEEVLPEFNGGDLGTFEPNREWRMLDHACVVLATGQVPADLRAALYRVLARLPGVQITDPAANLDGRSGVGYGLIRGDVRRELIIEPGTGDLIGVRETRGGTVWSSTALTTGVAPGIGVRPPG